jgi:hypothetical protein
MPILLPFCALSLTLQYWCYKYLLLRYNRRPPTYGPALNSMALNALSVGIFFHIVIGVYMYGQPELFPTSATVINQALSSQTPSSGNSGFSQIIGRVYSTAFSSILAALAVILLAYAILNNTVFYFFRGLYAVVCCKKKEVAEVKF